MKILFSSPRLFFREWTTTDANLLFELNQNPKVLEYTGDVPFLSLKEAEKFIQNYTDYQKNGIGRWLVFQKIDAQFLGWCGLKKHKNFVDLGFRLKEEFWNNGFATEAAKATIEYGFRHLDLTEIIGRTMEANHASQKVLQKIGMHYSHKEWIEGLHEAMIFKIEKSNYFNSSQK